MKPIMMAAMLSLASFGLVQSAAGASEVQLAELAWQQQPAQEPAPTPQCGRPRRPRGQRRPRGRAGLGRTAGRAGRPRRHGRRPVLRRVLGAAAGGPVQPGPRRE